MKTIKVLLASLIFSLFVPASSYTTGDFLSGTGSPATNDLTGTVMEAAPVNGWNIYGALAGSDSFGLSALDGSAFFAGGDSSIDSTGLTIDTTSSTFYDRNGIHFIDGEGVNAQLTSYQSESGSQNFTRLMTERSRDQGILQLYSYGNTDALIDMIVDDGSNTILNRITGTETCINCNKRSGDTKIYGDTSARPILAVIGADKLTYLGDGNTLYPAWIPITKPAIEQIQSDTTLSPDSNLQFPVAANTAYSVKIHVYYRTPAAADFKFDLSGPASPSRMVGSGYYVAPGAVSQTTLPTLTSYASSANTILSGTVGDGIISIELLFENGANDGTFSFRWAQNTSSANNTTSLLGSYIEYTIVKPGL